MSNVTARDRQRAFTLIEVLVAIVILGVVALLAYRATAAMTDGEVRVTQESDRWRTLDLLFARLEADMRQAIPRNVRNGNSIEPAWLAMTSDSAGNSALSFTRAGPEFASEPGIAGQRIGYRLRDGTLEALYWPQLDSVPSATIVAYPLVNGIDRFRITQLTSANTWSAQWPLRGPDVGVPRAARVELVLSDGTTIERLFALR